MILAPAICDHLRFKITSTPRLVMLGILAPATTIKEVLAAPDFIFFLPSFGIKKFTEPPRPTPDIYSVAMPFPFVGNAQERKHQPLVGSLDSENKSF